MFTALFISVSSLLFPSDAATDLQTYRQEYQRIAKTETAIHKIIEVSKTSTLTGTTSEAYAAAAILCSAKYKSSPIAAYSTFNKGRLLLDAVIKKDTFNVDARFIRYTIQVKAPAFLGYTSSCNADRAFLLEQLPRLRSSDAALYAIVQSFMLMHDPKAKEQLVLATKSSEKKNS